MLSRLIGKTLVRAKLVDMVTPKFVATLCERYQSLFWKLRYMQMRARYAHPVWHPHRLDLATWPEHRNCHFLERGVYSHQVISPGDIVLDLCCGDGFYAYFFFSGPASRVDAVDIDEVALAHAQKNHAHPKIHYFRRNIITEPFPMDHYDVVIWDSAIRRLKKEDIDTVLGKIARVLDPQRGVFSCYEIFEDEKAPIAFITPLSASEMVDMLKKHFPTVEWVETRTPDRDNYYFHCRMRPGSSSFKRAGASD